jgi:hypothetical protein
MTRDDFTRSTMLKVKDAMRNVVALARTLRMVPRQLREAFRLMGHLLHGSQHQQGKLLWCYGAASILLSLLAVARPPVYNRIGIATAPAADFEELLKNFPTERQRAWWAAIIATGYKSKDEAANEELIDAFVRMGLLDPDESARSNFLGQFWMGWGDSSNGFQQVFESLEGLKSFGQR